MASEILNCVPRPGALCVEANLEAAKLAGADLGRVSDQDVLWLNAIYRFR